MSVTTAVTTIVGLDVLLLGLLAYVMRMPFRMAPSDAATAAPVQPKPHRTVAHDRPHLRSRRERALAGASRLSVATDD